MDVIKKLLCFILIICILFSTFSEISYSDPINLEEESTEEIKNSLTELTIEEKKILESLFTLVQEIMEMEYKEKTTEIEILNLQENIKSIEIKIENETLKYNTNLDIMEDILKYYQKNGANSYLELILSSKSLSVLLKRLNAIRDISKSTSELLESLEASKNKLIIEKQNIASTLELIKARQEELKEALRQKVILREDLELRLVSLQEDRNKYEEYLVSLEKSFNEIKPIFSNTINTFVKMVEDGELPEEVIDITLSFPTINGVIKGDILSKVLSLQEFPTKLDLLFMKDILELHMPEINIIMRGNLEILNDQALVYKVNNGEYMGLPLEVSVIEELFKDGYLQLNFKVLLGKNKIKSINIMDDRLELIITPVLF